MSQVHDPDSIKVGLAQIAPAWLNRELTLKKILEYTSQAGESGCNLVAFSEGLIPGYPFWIERTGGAEFNSPMQKKLHAHYLSNAVQIEAGHLDSLSESAKLYKMAVMVGIIERPGDRGGHSLYASLVYIDPDGIIQFVHRKLMPTYEERLTWSIGDGHGLRVHRLGPFTIGGLNCWENWIPLARAALYGQGEDLHVAVWPGGVHNTRDITRFIALESRSYVLSVSGLMRSSDVPKDLPYHAEIIGESDEVYANGGSCIAAPDGSWLVEPAVNEERLIVETLNYDQVRQERQNFDPAGHYSRPDVLKLTVNRERQSTIQIVDK